jgi:hypothetical protein
LSPPPLLGSSSGEIKIWAIATNLKSFVHLFDVPARGFVNSLQILAVPTRNVQPDKWISDKLRKEQTDKKTAEKKERRRLKRHGEAGQANANATEDTDAEGPAEGIEVDGISDLDEDEEVGDEDEDMKGSTTPSPAAQNKTRTVSAKADPEILLIASLSREPRLGRWDVMKERSVRNGTLIVHLGKQA